MSALRAAGRHHLSASKFVSTRQATGSHVFQIDTYAQARRMMAPGEKIRSDKFSVGGHDWRVECYPNGSLKHEGFISVYLRHAKTGDAMAKYRFSILDQSCWKPCPSCTKFQDEPDRFSDSHLSWSWGYADFIKQGDLDKEKHLKDECLTVLCDVTVTGLRADDDHADVAEPEPALVMPACLHGSIGELIWNKQPPDVKIKAAGETFGVHRWLLEAQSPVFKADLSLASAAGEGTAELWVDDMDADVCKALLEFIYTGTMDPWHHPFIYDGTPVTGLPETAGGTERVLIAADRYKLEKLKQICEKVLIPFIRGSSVVATLALAEQHHCPKLREACMQFLSSSDNLKAFMATDGLQKMKMECPYALELLLKQMARQDEWSG